MKTTPVIASSIALMLAAACGQVQPPNTASNMPSADSSHDALAPVQSAPMTANPVAGPTSADVPREAPAAGSSGSTEAQPAMQLTDGQILEITHAANLGEIDQAKIALSRTTDARVKSFAQMMVRDHSQADKKGMGIAKRAHLEREPSPASQLLESDVDSAILTLKSEPRADFDRSYVETQVRQHQSVLDTLDEKAMPDASNPDLKSYLGEVRAAVTSHLQHAQDLLSELQK